MKKTKQELKPGEAVFVGIDLHKIKWHVTIRTAEIELFCGSIPGNWEALRRILERYRGHQIQAVYEAGYFGFWLHDHLEDYGVECIVTPPSLIPQEYGNRVKTDRRDSRKLAYFLAKGMLKRVWVPTQEERYHRQVIRRRRQFVGDRIRTQSRIKAELRLYGIDLPEPTADGHIYIPRESGPHTIQGKQYVIRVSYLKCHIVALDIISRILINIM